MSGHTGFVVVVDAFQLRRACITSLLRDWAVVEDVTLLSLSLDETRRALCDNAECRAVILNVGSALVSRADTVAEIKVLRALAPAAAVVVVADRADAENVLAAMQAGTEGYITSQLNPDLVFRALSFVLHGGTCFPRAAVREPLVGKPDPGSVPEQEDEGLAETRVDNRERADPRSIAFSDRQLAILAGLCRGEPNKVIGRMLDLPESTVKVHVREIMRKLAVSNRTQVAIVVTRVCVTASAEARRAATLPRAPDETTAPAHRPQPALTR